MFFTNNIVKGMDGFQNWDFWDWISESGFTGLKDFQDRLSEPEFIELRNLWNLASESGFLGLKDFQDCG